MKIPLWKNNVLSKNFSDFPLLSQYIKESEWEFHDVSVEDNLFTLIVGHLDLLHNNLTVYFPEENDHHLKANMWILQRFNDAPTEDEELLELRAGSN